MEHTTVSDIDIQWHPAFCAATELELSENKEELDFLREYNLSKKPLQVDLLVIEKRKDVEIRNEIGHIFRRYNVIEYKSPGDGMTIDDFFKTVGYACIYKGQGKSVDQIPADQLTVSLFREGFPEEMFRSLEKYGYAVEKKADGIYYVKGFPVPAQVVVIRELEGGKHRSLRILSRSAQEEDICGFVEEAKALTGQGERANVDAVLQVSMSANYGLYMEMKRRYPIMCEAMRQLMKEEIDTEVKNAEIKSKKEMALSLAGMGISIDKIAEAARVSVNIVQEWLAGSVSMVK